MANNNNNNPNKFRFRVIDRSSVDQYLRNKNIDKQRDNLLNQIQEHGLENLDLVSIAQSSNDSANLIKDLVISNQIDNVELANQIAKFIVHKIELQVDNHLEKYQKFTLNFHQIDTADTQWKAQFFNLISLLKDVSVLGRKLIEMAPHFTPQAPQIVTSSSAFNNKDSLPPSSPSISINSGGGDSKSLQSGKSTSSSLKDIKRIDCREEDATSEDLLAALIESSSSDDFLVLSSSLESIQVRDMILAALIYIKSHECFTLSHDIQGVVMVLKRVKFIIMNILAPRNQVELITKLLTSIGRYSEMNYVFDLFRDRNQFEVLLSKGVEKTPELRIALFNYVKKNPEFYALVTLNFSMFREIAESLEASANKRLNKITTIHCNKLKNKNDKTTGTGVGGQQQHHFNQKETDNQQSVSLTASTTFSLLSSSPSSSSVSCNPAPSSSLKQDTGTAQTITKQITNSNTSNRLLYSKESLNLSLVELVDASDCYAKAGCYMKSNNCERKAKLIALQLALLPLEINVLDVKQSELIDLIVNFKSFLEAFIVADAYEFHLAWRQALFKQVILNGSMLYLEQFCDKWELSSVLVEELVILYKQHLNNNIRNDEESSEMAKAMSSLISKLSDVELKCKLYTQLKFDNAKEELTKDMAVRSYLMDLRFI